MTITPTTAAPDTPEKKGRIPALEQALPDPLFKIQGDFGVHIMGIGGTGTVTVAATLATAARLEGKHVIGLDQTGLAQKGGAVISDIKVTAVPFSGSNKISDGCTDLYLGFDILNATDPKNLDKCHPDRTIAVVSTMQTPTGYMVTDRHVQFPALTGLIAGIERVTRKADDVFLDGQALAEGLFGDSMATNLFMVGAAFQSGALPLKAESIERAIEQGGVSVKMGLAAFKWGRMAVIDRTFVFAEIAKGKGEKEFPTLLELTPRMRAIVDSAGAQGELQHLLEVRVPELVAYQNETYAKRYIEIIKRLMAADRQIKNSTGALSEVVARYLYKLMAYKDEYEVARLHTDPVFLAKLQAQFRTGYKVQYHLAPPLFSKRDPITGELQKRSFGPWVFSAFKLLARMKFLRGGAFDIFGKTVERRHERQMIEDYIKLLNEIVSQLNPDNYEIAVSLASVPDEIRGYGHVKERTLAVAKELQAQQLQAFRNRKQERLAA